jgi:hypothetical protein
MLATRLAARFTVRLLGIKADFNVYDAVMTIQKVRFEVQDSKIHCDG